MVRVWGAMARALGAIAVLAAGQDVVAALPENLRLIKSETRRWREKPHGGFRTAPHTHEACFFLVERV